MHQCVVKISVSSVYNYTHIDEVIYYRSGMTPDFLNRWMWFFEYLSARVKVSNPHRRVVLWSGPVDMMLGSEWHDYRRNVLLKTRNSKLNKLVNSTPENDLFGFGCEDLENRVNSIKKDIDLLEKDNFPISEFPEYINKLKHYIYGTSFSSQS